MPSNLDLSKTRRQLTLFIDPEIAVSIEKVRQVFNPVQYDLIKSHVTLCREDELDQLEIIIRNLLQTSHHPITIHFGNAIRFSGGNGVLIPATLENEPYDLLRKAILQNAVESPRKREPHITLMHPRNSICTDEIFQQIQMYRFPNQITFRRISLIEQKLGKIWQTIDEFDLKGD